MIRTLMRMLGYVPETHLAEARRNERASDRRLTIVTDALSELHRQYTDDVRALTDAVMRESGENDRLREAMRGMMARADNGTFFNPAK
jgi:hypothetical protein